MVRRHANTHNFSNKFTCDRCKERRKLSIKIEGAYGYTEVCQFCVDRLSGDYG